MRMVKKYHSHRGYSTFCSILYKHSIRESYITNICRKSYHMSMEDSIVAVQKTDRERNKNLR